MACVRRLHRAGRRLPLASRWWRLPKRKASATKPPFWAPGASIRALQPGLAGPEGRRQHAMRAAMHNAGLCIDDIATLQRGPYSTWASLKSISSKAPVLSRLGPAPGAWSPPSTAVHFIAEMIGTANCTAGTTPMDRRRDAAVAVAELALYVEQRAAQDGDSVSTIEQPCWCRAAPSTWCPTLPIQPGPARAHRHAACAGW